ncbi:MAG: pyridoxamine 5'-phosphate oxidase family protein [Planctomycetes bacterium]|nr:pyridoxamine 5'-phosphate oxidase family protein [Planctomycetota bacterium]
MNQKEMLSKLQELLDDSKTGLLGTTDADGKAFIRWMTPVVSKDRANTIFCVTREGTDKIKQVEAQPHVEWMIQNKSLTEIVNVRGVATVLENPALKTEVLETLGSKLTIFWKVDLAQIDLVVIETVIQEAVYFRPMKGERVAVQFG